MKKYWSVDYKILQRITQPVDTCFAGYQLDIGEETTVTTKGFHQMDSKNPSRCYPAGGLIDGRLSNEDPGGAVNGDGNQGAGVTPILLASWVDFMQAEKALFSDNDAAAARTHLEME